MNNPYSAPTSTIEDLAPDETALTYQPKFFALNGRINRVRFWAYNTGAVLIALTISCAFLFIIPSMRESVLHGRSPGALNEYLIGIPVIIGNMIMIRRRLQDIEASPWFMFVAFVPYISRVFTLVLSFKKGTEGRNEYGPAPAPNTVGLWMVALSVPVLFVVGVGSYAAFHHKIDTYLSQPETTN